MARPEKRDKPKLSDVAQAAGVSVSMVSRILSRSMGNTSASDEVIQRVRKAAKELNYSPDMRARNLRMGKNELIAVIMPLGVNYSISIYTELLRGLVEGSKDCGYDFIYRYYRGNEEEKKAVHAVQKMNIDGLIYAPNPYMPMADEIGDMLRQLVEHDIKVVFCMERFNIPGTLYVDVDDAQGGALMATHLLTQGHRDILYIHHLMRRREEAFLQTAAEGGATVVTVECDDFNLQNGIDVIQRMVSKKQRIPHTIACVSDVIAVGVREAMLASGLSPEDYTITGFDYLSFMPLLERPFPSIYQPAYEVGRLAVSSLLRAVSGERVASVSLAPQLMLPTK